MHTFLFKCPNLGMLVQGGIEKSAMPRDGALVSYQCPACATTHLVDPRKSERPRQPESK